MATMITEVYEAFRKVGIPDPEAKHAAEALSAENVSTKADINAAEERLRRYIDKSKEELAGRITDLDEKLNPKIVQTGSRHGRNEMDDGDNHSRHSLPYRGCRLHCDQTLFLNIKILLLTPACPRRHSSKKARLHGCRW